MGFLNVSVDGDVMRVSKTPGIKSISAFVGIVSLGLGAAYYGSDNLLMKCGYIFGCFLIAFTFVEDWEVCTLDKISRKGLFSRRSLYQMIFYFARRKEMDISLNNVISVRVESNLLKALSETYNVALVLRSGMSLGIVETFISRDKSKCDMLAERIRTFLKLSHIEAVDSVELDDCRSFSDHESSSSDSEVQVVANAGQPRESVTLINERR